MPQLIGVVLIGAVVLYLVSYIVTAIIISSLAIIGSVIIITIGSYFLRKSIINKMLSKKNDFLGGVNYSINSINKQKDKINLYAFFAVIYSLFIMLEGQTFHIYFISNLKYNLGIYTTLNNNVFNYDAILFGAFIVYTIVIYSFTAFIKKKFTNWVSGGIEKKVKENPSIIPKPKRKTISKPKKPKNNTQINSSQYGINSNTPKQEIKKILNREFQKWHNASRSPNIEIVKKSRTHKKNIAILRSELL